MRRFVPSLSLAARDLGQSKVIERTRGSRQLGWEVLLMNYSESLGGLWQE